jgi:Cu-processing system permease protein
VLILAVLLDPVDAVRTTALLGTLGAAAFGSASLAFLRFTRGPWGAATLLGLSLVLWTLGPALLAIRRLQKTDV